MATKRHIADLWATRKIAEHPGALDSASIFYAARKNGELSWPEWCGLPMASTYAILTNGADLTTAKEMLAQMGVEELAALTAALIWVRAKAVYKFDPDLGAALLAQPFDDNLPAESLYVLPQFCVFIDYPMPIGDSTAAGMFAWLEFDVHSRTPELRLLYLMPDMSIVSMPIILTGGTLDDSMVALAVSALSRGPAPCYLPNPSLAPSKEQIAGAINMVLYLCSSDRDMPDSYIRRSTNRYGNPKHIRIWDVGIRIGSALRKYRRAVEDHQRGSHESPRPHVRRAHWHHFWTGPRDGERKLVVKWLPPIPVNYDPGEDLPTVIQFVQK